MDNGAFLFVLVLPMVIALVIGFAVILIALLAITMSATAGLAGRGVIVGIRALRRRRSSDKEHSRIAADDGPRDTP